MKKCDYCGKDHQRQRRFCSDLCRIEFHRDKKRPWRGEERLCENCGKVYTIKRFDQSFCGTDCYRESIRLNKIRQNAEKPKPTVTCNHCGKDFVSTKDDPRQQFCSHDCNLEYYKSKMRNRTAEQRATIIRCCPICDKEFTPKRTLKEKYCSVRCRTLFSKKIHKAIQTCLKLTNEKKMDRSHKLLGYTPRDLQEHVQRHPNWPVVKGGPWHLDHIFPIIAFVEHGIKDISVICRLDNLQPLTGPDNTVKNRKYDEKEFLSWLNERQLAS